MGHPIKASDPKTIINLKMALVFHPHSDTFIFMMVLG